MTDIRGAAVEVIYFLIMIGCVGYLLRVAFKALKPKKKQQKQVESFSKASAERRQPPARQPSHLTPAPNQGRENPFLKKPSKPKKK